MKRINVYVDVRNPLGIFYNIALICIKGGGGCI